MSSSSENSSSDRSVSSQSVLIRVSPILSLVFTKYLNVYDVVKFYFYENSSLEYEIGSCKKSKCYWNDKN